MQKISVVIPVYNAMTAGGGYIVRCIDSVLHQSNFPLSELEILVINDGSTDESADVLEVIRLKYPATIRIVNQSNIGVAATRNKAVKLVRGEYVVFLDQDDWIDEDFCATMYKAANEFTADVVVSGYRRPCVDGKVIKRFQPSNTKYGSFTISAAWAKIHKTSFLREENIQFFENSYGEDLPFTAKENLLAKSHHTIQYIGYNWFFNKESVSNASQKTLTPETIRALERLLTELCSVTPNGAPSRIFNYYLLRTVVFYLLFSGKVAHPKDFLLARNALFQIIEGKDSIFRRENIHKLLVPPSGESFTVGWVVSMFIIVYKLRLLPIFANVWCKPPKNIK